MRFDFFRELPSLILITWCITTAQSQLCPCLPYPISTSFPIFDKVLHYYSFCLIFMPHLPHLHSLLSSSLLFSPIPFFLSLHFSSLLFSPIPFFLSLHFSLLHFSSLLSYSLLSLSTLLFSSLLSYSLLSLSTLLFSSLLSYSLLPLYTSLLFSSLLHSYLYPFSSSLLFSSHLFLIIYYPPTAVSPSFYNSFFTFHPYINLISSDHLIFWFNFILFFHQISSAHYPPT